MNHDKYNLPDLLGVLRLFSAFILLLLAWHAQHTVFIAVLIFAFLLDAIDGPIARHYHQTSEAGARLDSIADFSVYLVLMVSVWWLWPDIVASEAAYIIVAAISIVLPVLVGWFKFYTWTSYHTWLVKFATVCIAPASVLLILEGPAWPFHIATVVCVLAAIEEITITLILDKPKADVQHVWAVLRSRKNSK